MLAAACFSMVMMAIPARPGQWKMITLADGSQVRVELRGDEYGSFWAAADGRKFMAEGETYRTVTADELQTIRAQRFAQLHPEGTQFGQRTLPTFAATENGQKRITLGGAHTPYEGTKKCLCLLMNFSDKKFKANNNLDYFKDFINKVGYSNPTHGHVQSFRDYFLAQSNGKFDLDFDVIGPFDAKNGYAYYGANGWGGDKNVSELVSEAFAAADPYVNYKDYDWDGDGYAEAIIILYAGAGEADGGDANTIWPHQSQVMGQKRDDVIVNTYACFPELGIIDEQTREIGNAGIGTMIHEYSHCLGLPDFYDTNSNENFTTSFWDIMDSAPYLNYQRQPAGYNAYERWYCGWLEPIELKENCEITGMKPLTSGGEAYIIYNDANRNEYYLIENRAQEGSDEKLYGSGMLVYHVYYNQSSWANNQVNQESLRGYDRFQLVCADGKGEYTYNSIIEDPYPLARNNALGEGTVPNMEAYGRDSQNQRTTFNKPIYDIKKLGDLISFKFENRVGKLAPGAPEGAVFFEGFTMATGVGANDKKWTTESKVNPIMDNAGWTANNAFSANNALLVGTTVNKDALVTPTITLDGEYELQFKAAPFFRENTPLLVQVAEGAAALEKTSFDLTLAQILPFSTRLTATGPVKISFSSKSRFYIDDIAIVPVSGDGIREIKNEELSVKNPGCYNLMGQRVNGASKGVIIYNGRKYIQH